MRKHREGYGCIYKITNLINDDAYVGKDKTGDPENNRWDNHIKTAAKENGGVYFHSALRKYGVENFCAEVIWRGPIEELNTKEIYYIKKYHTFVGDLKYTGGYNLTPGGDGRRAGSRFSEKAKKNLTAAIRRRFSNPMECAKQIAIAQIRWARPNAREEASAIMRRRYEDPAERVKTSLQQQHRFEDLAEHEKVSAALRRRFEDTSEREKMSLAQLRSYEENPERSKNHSIAMTQFYTNPEARKRQSKAALRPEVRKKNVAAAVLYWSKLTSHEKASAAQLLRFENSAERERQSEASKLDWQKRRLREAEERGYKVPKKEGSKYA